MPLTTAVLSCACLVCTRIAFPEQNKECLHTLRLPSLCIAAQGAKTVIVGDEVCVYNASRMIVFSVAAQVTQASHSAPYLSLKLDLDPQKIAELLLKVYPHGLPPAQERRAIYLTLADGTVAATIRLMECLAARGRRTARPTRDRGDFNQAATQPHWCSRRSNGLCRIQRPRCREVHFPLRPNFSQPMKVEELAGLVHMSVSCSHEHVKSVTSMSRLHHQKVLRPQEVTRLMLSTVLEAGTASQRVGDLSASHFSREYSRFFGSAPTRDIARLRQETRLSDPIQEEHFPRNRRILK
jgi:AraC-like DNA-binding protein